MYRVIFTGWDASIQKISLTNLIKENSDLSLSQAKRNVDAIVDDIHVVINCPDKQKMYLLIAGATKLGVTCSILKNDTKAGKDLSLEKLRDNYDCYLTVGRLKKYLLDHNFPDDAKVLTERIIDSYYDDNWSTVKKEGDHWNYLNDLNKKCEGEFLDKKRYPEIENVNKLKSNEEQLHDAKDEYSPAWCCVKYDDDDNLYLNLHY